MSEDRDKILNILLNKELLLDLLYILEAIVINPSYGYKVVFLEQWEEGIFNKTLETGYICYFCDSDEDGKIIKKKYKPREIESMFNDLAKNGWRLISSRDNGTYIFEKKSGIYRQKRFYDLLEKLTQEIGVEILKEKQETKLEILKEKIKKNNLDKIPIEDLELSVRAYNSLKRAQIHKISDLLDYSLEDLWEIKNFGSKSAEEIQEALTRLGLQLPSNKTTE